MIQVTAHFTLEELVASPTATQHGIDNTPTPEAIVRLAQLAAVLEQVRVVLGGKPMLITSAYRCFELNRKVQGVPDSAHLWGCAADFHCPAFGTPSAVWEALKGYVEHFGIDQLIDEHGRWVHLGLANPPWVGPRYQKFKL